MLPGIKIDAASSIPKYLQIVEGISSLVAERKLKKGQQLPTINDLCKQLGVGRVTVVNAYNLLRSRGILDATHGKGFYIKNSLPAGIKNIFLLFDAMNGYKEVFPGR